MLFTSRTSRMRGSGASGVLLGEALGLAEGLGEADGDGEGEGEGLGLGVGVGVGVEDPPC